MHGGDGGDGDGGLGGLDGNGVALLLARDLEAQEVLAAGLDGLELLDLDLNVVGLGLGDVLDGLVLVDNLLGGGDSDGGGHHLVGVVHDRGVEGVRGGVGVGQGLHRLDDLHVIGADGGEHHGEHQLERMRGKGFRLLQKMRGSPGSQKVSQN